MEKEVTVGNKKFRGYEIKIGTCGEPPSVYSGSELAEDSRTEKTLVLIVGERGYLACGYWNLETAEKFGDCCVIITGVNTIEEMLEKKVVAVSKKAKEVGINLGMSGREALQKIT